VTALNSRINQKTLRKSMKTTCLKGQMISKEMEIYKTSSTSSKTKVSHKYLQLLIIKNLILIFNQSKWPMMIK
jgi:hypothetical protein